MRLSRVRQQVEPLNLRERVSIQRHFSSLRNSRFAQIVLILGVLHLLPIWLFRFIPTQDGLSHVYNAYVLKVWNNPDYTKYREVYELNLTPFPNWTNYAFFYLALHVFPPLIAEKVFVTLCLLLYPLSFHYLFTAVDRRLRVFTLLGFLFSYNYLFHMGFYNFVVSVPLCLISLGFWWRHRSDFQLRHAAVLNLLLLSVYLSHFSSYCLLILALAFLSGFHFLLHLKKQYKELLQFAGYLFPAGFILLNTLLTNPEAHHRQAWLARHGHTQFSWHKSFSELWVDLLQVKALVYFNDSYISVSQLLLVVVAACVVWTGVQRIRARQGIQSSDGFLLLAGILVFFYFRLPWRYGSPAWINDRVHLFIYPLLFCWVFPPGRWLKRMLIGTMLLMALWHLGLTVRDYHLLNKDMGEFMSGAELIEPNATVSILEHGTKWNAARHHGPIKYLSPFYHGTVYYCLGNGSHYVANYEPKYAYFPLQYKGTNWKFRYAGGAVDYMLVWGAGANHAAVKALDANYVVIHETHNLKLFRHRSKDRD